VPQGGAESGAARGEISSDLSEVITAWPRPPASLRLGMVALIRATTKAEMPGSGH
jgi:hypothetical protein